MINIKYTNNYAYQLLEYQFILIIQTVFNTILVCLFYCFFCLSNLVLEFDYSISTSYPALNVRIKNEYDCLQYVLPFISHSF